MTGHTLRPARSADAEAVADLAADTWSDRGVEDYLPGAFPEWVATDGPDQRTLVATAGDDVVGVCQATMLGDDEGWIQGLRVHPDHRGEGHARALTDRLCEWCRDRGGTVARGMVFAWNPAGMGHLRSAGFDPVTACRWARPRPAETDPELSVADDVAAAYRFWTHSDARTALGGLGLDADETWALAELDRERLRALDASGRVFALVGPGPDGGAGGTRAMAARIGTRERESRTVADYAVGAWADPAAAAALFDVVRADTAACGADAARVPVPDTPRFVSDGAAARAGLGDHAVFVFAADLTAR